MKVDNDTAYKLAMAVYNATIDLSIDDNGDKRDFSNINVTYGDVKTIRGALQDAREYLNDVINAIWK